MHQDLNLIASEYSNTNWLHNIGNWGLHYQFHTALQNNHTTAVKFKGYIIANPKGHCAGIASGGIGMGKFLGDPSYVPQGYRRWNFCETSAIPASGSITLDYQYSHLSKGCAPCILQWEAVPF